MNDKISHFKGFEVFLCHNSEDKPEVRKIGVTLIKKGISPWLDEWELPPGLPWQRLLEKQITEIPAVAVFVGASGIGPWQQQEIEAYLREFVARGCPVIPVILPSVSEEPDLPIFLKGFAWVDLRKTDSDQLQRLIWGIRGDKQQVHEVKEQKKGQNTDKLAKRTVDLLKRHLFKITIISSLINAILIGYVVLNADGLASANFIQNSTKSIINAIDVPILIYKKQNKNISVFLANRASQKFYQISEAEIIGQTPEELHYNVKDYVSNYTNWAGEQNDRKVLAGSGRKLGKTKVPMILFDHPEFVGDWYLTSEYYRLGKQEYILTRFSRTEDVP